MSLRRIVLVAAVLLCLGAAWSKRQGLLALLEPRPPASKPIQFDNGTVRDYRPASDAGRSSLSSQLPAGTMRKCLKGQEVAYTNTACPVGYKEKAVGGTPVNVLQTQAPTAPNAPQGQAKARSSLHDALDLSGDDKLRDRMMERAIEGKR